MKKIKIYSNKRDVKQLERIFLALEVGKKKRMRCLRKKEGLKRRKEGGVEPQIKRRRPKNVLAEKVLGLKKCFGLKK